MVSGPDFKPEAKWRRDENSPNVTPMEFNKGLARRIEGHIRNDFTAIPIVRSVCYKWAVEHSGQMLVSYSGERNRPASVIATEMVQAMQGLYTTLWKGCLRNSQGKKIPIAGDTTKLPLADGLTPLQRRMAWHEEK